MLYIIKLLLYAFVFREFFVFIHRDKKQWNVLAESPCWLQNIKAAVNPRIKKLSKPQLSSCMTRMSWKLWLSYNNVMLVRLVTMSSVLIFLITSSLVTSPTSRNAKFSSSILLSRWPGGPGGDGLAGATPEDAADWPPQCWLEQQLEERKNNGVAVTDVDAHLVMYIYQSNQLEPMRWQARARIEQYWNVS